LIDIIGCKYFKIVNFIYSIFDVCDVCTIIHRFTTDELE
jgi:hypothetical protein